MVKLYDFGFTEITWHSLTCFDLNCTASSEAIMSSGGFIRTMDGSPGLGRLAAPPPESTAEMGRIRKSQGGGNLGNGGSGDDQQALRARNQRPLSEDARTAAMESLKPQSKLRR